MGLPDMGMMTGFRTDAIVFICLHLLFFLFFFFLFMNRYQAFRGPGAEVCCFFCDSVIENFTQLTAIAQRARAGNERSFMYEHCPAVLLF